MQYSVRIGRQFHIFDSVLEHYDFAYLNQFKKHHDTLGAWYRETSAELPLYYAACDITMKSSSERRELPKDLQFLADTCKTLQCDDPRLVDSGGDNFWFFSNFNG